MYGKPWAVVIGRPEGSAIGFQDWFDQIRAIGRCEVEKYCAKYGGDPASREAWERWTKMPREFMEEAWAYDATYEVLRDKHRLPR
jgi:hypothetical protein